MSRPILPCLCVMLAFAALPTLVSADTGREIIAASGVHGGLVVHVHCEDGTLTASLGKDERFLVQGLDVSKTNVERARRRVRSLGRYGRMSIDTFAGAHLPYVDNLVNLVVAENLRDVSMDEVMRVLAPLGVAYVNGKKTVKPWPEEIDEWTHYLHGPDNNAVAQDTVIGPPAHVQWIAPPKWSRNHESHPGTFGAVSSRGRLFYVQDEGPIGIVDKRFPGSFSLNARDAFNGVMLWKRNMNSWYDTGVHWQRVPQQLNMRLVAIGDRLFVTMGIGERVSMLDAATGETLGALENTEDTSEILYNDGVMVVLRKPPVVARRMEPTAGAISAIDVKTNRLLWERGGIPQALSLASKSDSVYFVLDDHATCVGLRDGKERWRVPFSFARQGHFPNAMGIILAGEDVVVMLKTGLITALSAESGERLWEQEFKAAKSEIFASPQDAFIVDGLVWPSLRGVGYDLLTGEKARTTDRRVIGGHHHRCHLRKATTKYILGSQNGIEFFDVQGKKPSQICNTFRGSCRLGVVPCNGLLYLPPNSCKCFIEAQMHGFLAIASQRQPANNANAGSTRKRLEQGPAFDQPLGVEAATDDWPTYRNDAKRSGIAGTELQTDLTNTWTVSLGTRITPPVAVGSRVYLSFPERHAVVCLDSRSGKKLWEHTAGARIDSPPTYYRGTLLFGSTDGWVYSITADQGVLRWRYRCAPEERLMGANEQLESLWPVSGSILVQNDIAYAAAGRCSMVDGGIYLYAFNPVDGRVLHHTVETDPGIIDPEGGATAYYTAGVLGDILVGDGEHVYLRHRKFDRELVKRPDNHIPPTAVRHLLNTGLRLYASAGFTDTDMHHRTYWAVGENFGSLLAFDSKTTYGTRVYNARMRWSPRFDPATTGCLVYAAATAGWKGEGKIERKTFEEFFPGMNTTEYTWSQSVPILVRAMLVARDVVFVAGPPDVVDSDDPLGALRGRLGGVIKVVSATDGEDVSQLALPRPPIFDGMAAAAGRLYISCSDGSLVSMGASDD